VTARVERSRRDAHRLLGVHTPIDTAVNHAVAARRRRTHASERALWPDDQSGTRGLQY
jgi:ribosomal protein L15E